MIDNYWLEKDTYKVTKLKVVQVKSKPNFLFL